MNNVSRNPLFFYFLRYYHLLLAVLFFFFLTLDALNAQVASEIRLYPEGNESYSMDYGASVAIEGNIIFVGAPGEDGYLRDYPNEGAVFVYQRELLTWTQKQVLKASDIGAGAAGQSFGHSLALDNNWAIIGAPAFGLDSPARHGKAYFFYNDGQSWSETQIISVEEDSLLFSSAVDIDGEWAVIGVPNDTGSVYIYRYNGGDWNLYSHIQPSDGIENEKFGRDVSVSGQRIIVGSDGHGAYIYQFDGSDWLEEKIINVTDAGNTAISGRVVSILGDRAVIGSVEFSDGPCPAIFEYNGTSWTGITLSEYLLDSREYLDVAQAENVVIVGNPFSAGPGNDFPFSGTILAYNSDDVWSQAYAIVPGGLNQSWRSYQYFGFAVDIDNAVTVGGGPWADDGMGAVYVHELAPAPAAVTATSAAYNDRVRVSWDKETVIPVTGFNIYREGEWIASTTAGAVAYSDYGAVPGKLQLYGVSGVTKWGASLPAQGLGWIPVNGELEGSVSTLYGAGVDSVEMQIISDDIDLSSALEFGGVLEDYLLIEGYNRFPTEEVTVSMWIKTEDAAATYFFSYATSEIDLSNDNTFLIGIPGDLQVYMDTGPTYQQTGPTGVAVNDGNWHHLAVSWQNSDGELNIIKDGVVVFTGQMQTGNSIPDSGTIVFAQDQDYEGGGFQASQSFEGLLDEVQIWDKVVSPEEIRENMLRKLKGDEFNLISYWPFDDLPDRAPQGIAGDYAKNSGMHGKIFGAVYSEDSSPAANKVITDGNGKYELQNIYYGPSALFDVVPYKEGHAFDPQRQSIVMNEQSYKLRSVNFVDTTVMTVRGNIKFAGTNCNAAGVEILLDNVSEGIYTNAAGSFSFLIERPGIYNLKPVWADSVSAHGFIPAQMNVNVQDDVFNLAFSDTTRHRLTGKFGASCANNIGSAEIIISSINNNNTLFRDTIYTDSQGYYDVFLPAQPYKADVLDVSLSDNSLVEEFVRQYFAPDTIDLTWADRANDFTYRNTPVIKISGWPRFGSGIYNVPILEQGDYYDLTIELLDVWGEDSCLVNQGSITVTDVISGVDDNPLTRELQDGTAYYRIVPDEPLILSGGNHPFQKMMQIVAQVGEETVDHIQWALITGSNPRTQTFTATTPEIPFLILRDPPGDQSYSYFSKDESISWTAVQSFQNSNRLSLWYDIRLGAITGTSVGTPFFSTEFEFGGYAIIAGETAIGTELELSSGTYNSFTFNQEFSTSDDDAVVGADGDVYLGASYVNLYALTDVLDYDWDAQNIILDTLLAWEPESVESFFSYTESHIRYVLLPQLMELKKIEASGANRQSLITKYDNSIHVWNTILLKNDTLKSEALYSDNFEYRNISFSAGAPYSASFTDESSLSYAYDFNIFVDTETAIGAGAVLFGVPAEGGIKISASIAYKRSNELNTTQTVTTGFTLADDDPGDFFSVNIKSDPAYGTPVFELFGGTSSNPWEKGTQPRDGVNIALNTFVKYDVPPDQPAPFILYLGNTSESAEEREYHLKVLQASNLDGAVIRVGGVVIEDHLSYVIPAGEQLNATLTVERGPVAYDYENLQIKFYAPGDEDIIYDIATFSVHFISPCSEVNLLYPENNWVVNASDNDTLQIVINNYDLDNPYLEKLKFQYRRSGDGWATAYSYEKETIPRSYIMEFWRLDNLPDGSYELRVVSDCGTQGVKYSAIASGVIDRSALYVFGTPQPSDGMLNIGEDISVSFSGAVDPAFLTSKNIALFTADDSTFIEASPLHFENTIMIMPAVSLDAFDDRMITVRVSGVRDMNGNLLRQPVSWSFRVNRNPLFWTVSNVDYTVYQGRSDSFMRTLKNVGAQDEWFTILSHPDWLTVDINSGLIPPGGEQQITFSINTQLNIGTYRDTIVAATDVAEEKIVLALKILKKPPDWTVTAAEYAYSMNITAALTFDDTLSNDVFDMVCVYAGNEIRGVAPVQYLSTIDKYRAFINVYSNQASGESLTFRMWDASAGKEYAHLNGSYTFASNSVLGNISSPLVLRAEAVVQEIELSPGWTWFSLNVSNETNAVKDVLAHIEASDGDIIKGQRVFSQYDSIMGWCGRLFTLQTGQSYQIFLQNGGTIEYTGIPINQRQAAVPLYSGWNWLGHLNQKILDVNETLAALSSAAGDRIKSQSEFATYEMATQTWEGSLKKLVPGQGYLLKSGTAGTMQYPLGKTTFAYPSKDDWNVDIGSYEFSMGMTCVVEFDKSEISDTSVIVAAFSGFVCRGVTQLIYIEESERYMGFLPIYGHKLLGDSIYFQVYFPGESKTRQVTEKTRFVSNKQMGAVSSPYYIMAQPVGDELVPGNFYLEQNFPNPFNPLTTIEYGLAVQAKVKLLVYNTLGQTVATLVDEKQGADRYSIIFNPAKYKLSSGVYFYRIQAGSYDRVRKLLYLK